jgi:hypothetical protein
LGLGSRKESGSKSRGGENGLAHFSQHLLQFGG